jgi:hypothetical protein
MQPRRSRGVAAVGVAVLALLVPTTASAATADHGTGRSTGGAVPAEGDFVAAVDFSSLQARDVRGNKCEFTVDGTLTFSGTVDGTADGVTTAVIFAPCADALANPPGTFVDVFEFEGRFEGDVLGSPASGSVRYAGITRVGGGIDALITLRGEDARAVLRADARVAVGGTYRGVARADA